MNNEKTFFEAVDSISEDKQRVISYSAMADTLRDVYENKASDCPERRSECLEGAFTSTLYTLLKSLGAHQNYNRKRDDND